MAAVAKTAAAAGEEQFRAAVMEALTELMRATQQMREANAAFQAETRAHTEETQRRLEALEAREERRVAALETADGNSTVELPRRFTLSTLIVQLQTSWKVASFVVLGLVEVWQILSPHVTVH